MTCYFGFREHGGKRCGDIFSDWLPGDCGRRHFLRLIKVITLICLISLDGRKLASLGGYYTPTHRTTRGRSFLEDTRIRTNKKNPSPDAKVPLSFSLHYILICPRVLTFSPKCSCLRVSDSFYDVSFIKWRVTWTGSNVRPISRNNVKHSQLSLLFNRAITPPRGRHPARKS